MNKDELLDKAKKINFGDKLPLFKGIFIISQRRLHDSGFRTMYVVGHTDFDKSKNDFEYYLISTYSDVIDFTPIFDNWVRKYYDMCDLHIDINNAH